VLVLTGYASDENIRKALEYGADGCMAKPVKSAELKEKIAELLAAKKEPISRTA